jgi:hypothetical protein
MNVPAKGRTRHQNPESVAGTKAGNKKQATLPLNFSENFAQR